ncbi:MAG: aconitate hydratase [Chitinivibrionia bacterium]|nr:aconitate hydratase [Chitinivibrionia bacterium]
MKRNLTQKILNDHLVEGELTPGKEIGLRIDHTLLQDATGTLAMLEFEALSLPAVKAELAVQYVDHNILHTDYRNADDHKFLQTSCAGYGIHFSGAGNGVSHQVHMERFGVPGKTLLGADSHSTGAAGVSMLGIGAGGLDVALAMAGFPYYVSCPRVLGVKLVGELPDWVSAKDVILEMLRRLTVKGGVGKIIEYYGPGVATLSATDRETIGNMGAELGATSSIFPSDERTREYLEAQGRGQAWRELSADEGAAYDEDLTLDLSEVAGTRVDQVIVGSSVNSSFRDLMVSARILEGRHVHPAVSFHVNPGSRQVLENIARESGILALLGAGARVHEPGCLGCIGMGQAPGTGEISLRTFPRNFPGRSGTKDDRVYLCSPETATVSALKGVITDPRDLAGEMTFPRIRDPEQYLTDDRSIIFPSWELRNTVVVRGPDIRPLPELAPLPGTLAAEVVLQVGDNISTDAIMPAGNQVLPMRSNIEAISEHVFEQIAPDFAAACRARGAVVVVGGQNYGQGSSREHAALAPRYLGVCAKIVKSFARIHKSNLCNFGILPLTFKEPGEYDLLKEGTKVVFPDVRRRIERGDREIPIEADGRIIVTLLDVSEREREHLLAGGTLNYVKSKLQA